MSQLVGIIRANCGPPPPFAVAGVDGYFWYLANTLLFLLKAALGLGENWIAYTNMISVLLYAFSGYILEFIEIEMNGGSSKVFNSALLLWPVQSILEGSLHLFMHKLTEESSESQYGNRSTTEDTTKRKATSTWRVIWRQTTHARPGGK